MTSTSTFQGMNVETKPSSRVLAPPGGGSSNIFGSAEPVKAPPKREPAAPTKAPEPTPAPQSNQGERYVRAAPKQGEDSFQNLFGPQNFLENKNSPHSRQESRSETVRHSDNNNQSSPSTFDSLFGHAHEENRKKSRKPDDSFGNLFGGHDKHNHDSNEVPKNPHRKLGDSVHSKPQSPIAHSQSSNHLERKPQSPIAQSRSSSHLKSSFHRVFGEFQADSTPARSKRHSDCSSAYNPITGQPYDLPEQKKAPTAADGEADEKEGTENEQKSDTTTKPAVEAKEKTSTRIAQPPGGKSSGLW